MPGNTGNKIMASLEQTQKPTADYLAAIRDSALAGRTESQFVSDYLDGIGKFIGARPGYYRSYGPYWPAIKSLLVENNLYNATGEIDEDVLSIYSYDDDSLTVVAASLYQNMRLEDGLFYSAYHQLPVTDDDEPYEYYSYDLEQESDRP
ncbi:peptide-binding protein [Pseudocitrobacter sp. RIT415]|nr:peptide-binding protein [Pseudocitrobacter sp. RIT 415]